MTYVLAGNVQDYIKARQLLSSDEQDIKLSFPTIIAERDGEVHGFVSTHKSDQAVIMGAIRTKNKSGIMVIRLLEAYEKILEKMGITQYLIPVDKTMTELVDMTRRLYGLEPFHEDETDIWFRRSLIA